MDKKTKYPQSSSKGTAGDSKKSQDVANNKLFPKTSRKREPTGANSLSKYDQTKKYNTQKAKTFDKRPKPKGQYHGGSKEDTKVVEIETAEFGSVMAQGSKKQNLNHLLNFHYEPRDMQSGSDTWRMGNASKGYNRNSNRWLPPVQRHKYNKEQFLQASCQFVVTANEDYSLYLTDPDTLVDWKYIEQVKIHNTESLSCPICLFSPVAAKMTRCGHVYCWSCILHYLSLSDKSWRKCPICYESVHKSDLKSVIEVTQNAVNLGDPITLRLMRRERGSLIAMPASEPITATPTTFFQVSKGCNKQVYSKLLIANPKDIMDIIECERAQLRIELMNDPHSPENCYIEQAICELAKREEELLQKKVNDDGSHQEVIGNISSTSIGDKVEQEKQESHQLIQQSNDEVNNLYKEDQPLCKEATESSNIFSSETQLPSPSQKFFYFYQVEDGQNVYLHAMNVKMLEMQYGSLEHCPLVITGKLLEKEVGSFTEDLRRRLRYLCHLPLTCQFEVAEIELKPPIVSEDVLNSFHEQLETRQKRRQRREREERKREKKIIEEENKQMGKYPVPNVNIDSTRHFPQWQPELFTEDAIPSPSESLATSSVASSPSLSTFDEVVSTTRKISNPNEQGPSFAEMLRNTGARFKAGRSWPSVKPTLPERSKSVRSDIEEDDCAHAPSYSQSFGDALAQALEQTKLLNAEAKLNDNVRGKKKKKSKATNLHVFCSLFYSKFSWSSEINLDILLQKLQVFSVRLVIKFGVKFPL
ncbi:RING finger protein 10 [Vespula maculifrons]|uniref:E3 ubiquitin-protein ligase RNF10 n=1 Tax=Vespula maculifrons TaxID=7453 RepID=A0ABD2AL11_VESMC